MEAAPQNGDICLILLDEPPAERRIWLPPRVVIIGRNLECHLRLDSPLVSRRHCAIAPHIRGLAIRDLHSRNGTFVNGRAVEVQTLHDGDEVAVGPVRFVVRIPEATAFGQAGRLLKPGGLGSNGQSDPNRETDLFDARELELRSACRGGS